jgi:hypothetical protein
MLSAPDLEHHEESLQTPLPRHIGIRRYVGIRLNGLARFDWLEAAALRCMLDVIQLAPLATQLLYCFLHVTGKRIG